MNIQCDSSWGIGVIINEEGIYTGYGYPESDNPNLFFPDQECCTIAEYKNWKEAKKNWNT